MPKFKVEPTNNMTPFSQSIFEDVVKEIRSYVTKFTPMEEELKYNDEEYALLNKYQNIVDGINYGDQDPMELLKHGIATEEKDNSEFDDLLDKKPLTSAKKNIFTESPRETKDQRVACIGCKTLNKIGYQFCTFCRRSHKQLVDQQREEKRKKELLDKQTSNQQYLQQQQSKGKIEIPEKKRSPS